MFDNHFGYYENLKTSKQDIRSSFTPFTYNNVYLDKQKQKEIAASHRNNTSYEGFVFHPLFFMRLSSCLPFISLQNNQAARENQLNSDHAGQKLKSVEMRNF